MTRLTERMTALTADQRLHFYEVLAHILTAAIRGVWSDDSLGDAEKVERIKWVNEILHRATAKVWVLRLNTHEWTKEDFGSLVAGYVADCPGIASEVRAALNRSYRAVAGEDMG